MPCAAEVVVIVLAAGRGERFARSGGTSHKLQALLAGVPVMEHVLRAVKASGLRGHVVRPTDGTADCGMGDSIARGVRETAEASGWLILPADLPLVQASTLQRVATALQSQPVVVPVWRGQSGHPVGFAAPCRESLTALCGDHGAARVVQAHRQQQQVLTLEVDDPGIAADIDTVDDLAQAHALLAHRTTATLER